MCRPLINYPRHNTGDQIMETAMEAADQNSNQQNNVIALEVSEPGCDNDSFIVPR